jgi:uncharacterized peroxidase-related enzyme
LDKPIALPEYEQLSRLRANPASSSPANLPAVEESQAAGDVAHLYDQFRSRFGRQDVPGILKCFATHPPLLQAMMDIAASLLFADGQLVRRDKEMLATFVSSQNSCSYCADSHGYFFRVHGGDTRTLSAIQQNQLSSPSLSSAEQSLLQFAEKVNRSSHWITRADVETLIQNGWTEPQIAEAIHIVALFATFNRVANAFGLPSQGLLALFENDNSQHHADTPIQPGGAP